MVPPSQAHSSHLSGGTGGKVESQVREHAMIGPFVTDIHYLRLRKTVFGEIASNAPQSSSL